MWYRPNSCLKNSLAWVIALRGEWAAGPSGLLHARSNACEGCPVLPPLYEHVLDCYGVWKGLKCWKSGPQCGQQRRLSSCTRTRSCSPAACFAAAHAAVPRSNRHASSVAAASWFRCGRGRLC